MRHYKKIKTYAMDFETTNQVPSRVWASIAVDTSDDTIVHKGTDIEDFMSWLKANTPLKGYFHNLKHDSQAIIYWLLTHGFTYSEDPKPMSFRTLISDVGAYYSLEIRYEYSTTRHNYIIAKLWDSLKLIPMKLSVIAKAFDLDVLKGEIDYDKPRPKGYIPTPEEWAYVANDGLILSKALRFMFSEGLTKMTIGSNALNTYRRGLHDNKSWSRLYPELDRIIDDEIRLAYRGGWTYLNPKYKNRGVKGGIVLDVNSLYPYVMYSKLLPVGTPVYFKGDPRKSVDTRIYPLYITHVRASFIIRPEGLPTIQDKRSSFFKSTEYITDSDGVKDFWFTNVDLQLLEDNYFVSEIEYVDGWAFQGSHDLFKEYIDYWISVKKANTGAKRQIAKLMLNSLYGKFATNPVGDIKIPKLDTETGKVVYEKIEADERKLVYTALAVFVTAYAREKTIRSAMKLKARFIYADTDSLHLEGKEIPLGEWIDDKELGAWKIEESFVDSYYIRAKTYVELLDEGTLKVTCAGMPDNVKESVTLDNFREGAIFDGKLVPRIVEGGVILEKTTFTIAKG